MLNIWINLILLATLCQCLSKFYVVKSNKVNNENLVEMKIINQLMMKAMNVISREATTEGTKFNETKPMENLEKPLRRNISLYGENLFENKTKSFHNNLRFLYQNYKITYLDNKTLADFKRYHKKQQSPTKLTTTRTPVAAAAEAAIGTTEINGLIGLNRDLHRKPSTEIEFIGKPYNLIFNDKKMIKKKKKKTLKQKQKLKWGNWYEIEPSLNLTMDVKRNLVQVKLNGDNLRELFKNLLQLNIENADNTEKGRGKKYEIIMRVLPLFMIPFLIQSSIMPFLVTSLKLLLMKAMMVGKVAILLILVTALRNQKTMQMYEVPIQAPYWAGVPHRGYQMDSIAKNNP